MRIFVDSTPDKSPDCMNLFPLTIRLGVLTLAMMLLQPSIGWTQSRGNEGNRGGDRSDLKPVITGRVLDSLTGEGLAGVNVVAVGARDSALRTGVSTDAQGRFVLTLPRAGGTCSNAPTLDMPRTVDFSDGWSPKALAIF